MKKAEKQAVSYRKIKRGRESCHYMSPILRVENPGDTTTHVLFLFVIMNRMFVSESVHISPRGRLRRLNVRVRRDILPESTTDTPRDNLFSCINRVCLSNFAANYMTCIHQWRERMSLVYNLTLLSRRITLRYLSKQRLNGTPEFHLHARISQYACNTWQDSHVLKFRHSYPSRKNSILQIRTRIEQLFDVYVYLR